MMAPETKEGYDDSQWAIVAAPHDALVHQAASRELCPSGCSGHSYIPRWNMWCGSTPVASRGVCGQARLKQLLHRYRKHFRLPQEWEEGAQVSIRFDGVFRVTELWLNGQNISQHISGYTSFTVPLDRALLRFGNSSASNLIVLHVDPDQGRSGWWYEGGGLYRHVHLERTDSVRIAPDGIFAYANISGIADDSLTAKSASLHARVTVENLGGDAATAAVRTTLLDRRSGATVGTATSAPVSIPVGGQAEFTNSIGALASMLLWGPRHPELYTLETAVLHSGGAAGDALDRSFGFRKLQFDSTDGMRLNERHFKWRGFCDHDNFAVVGMAVPDRIKLFRAQASRSVGGNGRRTSHNAPDPVMLDIYDRVGIAVMDEKCSPAARLALPPPGFSRATAAIWATAASSSTSFATSWPGIARTRAWLCTPSATKGGARGRRRPGLRAFSELRSSWMDHGRRSQTCSPTTIC